MAALNESCNIMEFSFNSFLLDLELKLSFWFILLVIILALLYMCMHKDKNNFDSTELKFNVKLFTYSCKIQRNYENLEIAHKIYTELTTRKAALTIDPDKDVIKEIYDSWYALFKITREEMKNLSGKCLRDNKSQELIELATKILNEGLRPHLTTYQAKFRKWYEEELEKPENRGKSPQDVQKNFPEYKELVESMKEVNQLLIEYSQQLHKFITGK
ncbi:TPA: hypothetical protein HA351_08530 [Methanosarcinaceae archaeon]|nr:hypothetical protein [Methanosarcinaceae archaeon]